ncbi:hypothetical protein CONCODRAFT_80770 [Conidiobolus coronatus NRRL 28638]|uniref:Uncharacterized protein n=1 Tax=Conidiobolus coronatus (strain ATCC 28846 / CBS 209.66 / NRRL 28638) TaxID=796925 RepID=A0A137NRY7_CONC2|nr:hypothetical protein CONCODRAFT_80770 [Conidiobolus coronatus NRRL 28638]|eukprot:KXN65452.1 hypothetical protein CONCODRAFT_80770 [Conidiobolus coronatus NRRL 28638]
MNYEKIKDDVNKFKEIAIEEGLSGYCVIGSLLLELCLKGKGIDNTIVKGYLIVNDTYWLLHCWNKVEIDGETKQIDVSHHQMFVFGLKKQYTFELRNKWSTLMSSDSKRKEYDNITKAYDIYKEEGSIASLKFVRNNMLTESLIKSWKNVINRVKELETFENIEQYIHLANS